MSHSIGNALWAYKMMFGITVDKWQTIQVPHDFLEEMDANDDADSYEIEDDGTCVAICDSFKSGRPARNPHLSLQATSATRRDYSTHQIAYRRKQLQQARDQSSYAPKSAERLRSLKMATPVSSRGKYSPNKKSTSRHGKRAAACGDFTLA